MTESEQDVWDGRIKALFKRLPDEELYDRLSMIVEEFMAGFDFLETHCKGKEVTFFGSAREKEGGEMYEEASQLAFLLSKEGFSIITGGGPGIMEAGNKGAYEAGGASLGLSICLPSGQVTNKYVKESVEFEHFFTRKVMLAFAAEVYVFFPGGFGTMDEVFEILTLVQTKKTKRIPIILVGKSYWKSLFQWVEKEIYKKRNMVSKEDMELFRIVDSAEEAFKVIQQIVTK